MTNVGSGAFTPAGSDRVERRPVSRRTLRLVLVVIGHLCVVVGAIGVFVPLLPTTPFLLVAAACYARGSERFARWLDEHSRFGPPVRAWREHGVIPTRAKWLAALTIVGSQALSFALIDFDWRLKVVAGSVGLVAIAFIATRPGRPPAA